MAIDNARAKAALEREFPWGMVFAKRANFESRFFSEEKRLVARYLQPHSDVLVLGSGNGREARPICHRGHRIVCADVGALYLVYGQKLFSTEGVEDIAFLQANVTALPFANREFDFVFFSFYSSQGDRRFEVLEGIHRIMRPGGCLLLTACAPRYQEMYKEACLPMDGWTFIPSVEQLRQEVAPCGFELLESEVDPIRPEYRFAMLKKHE